jgi:hypothetical protein
MLTKSERRLLRYGDRTILSQGLSGSNGEPAQSDRQQEAAEEARVARVALHDPDGAGEGR